MFNIAIIGAGQLGSRHLQGLKNSNMSMHIFVIDNNKESLEVAKERYESLPVNSNQIVEYYHNIDQLPNSLDFVVIATGSKPRAAIIKSLLNHSDVKNLILEKVLFPRLNEYDEIGQLLKNKHIPSWVNCPRRMYGMYQDIKNRIDTCSPISMISQGNDWGLCCNSIHIIDIFMFLTGEKTYTITHLDLENNIIESKRPGYIEFYGNILIETPRGHKLTLKCGRGEYEPLKEIKYGNNIIKIQEENGLWTFNNESYVYKLPYQSQLTGLLADITLSIGYCPLTPYENSAEYHKPFIKAILNHYNKIKGINSDLCPIT